MSLCVGDNVELVKINRNTKKPLRGVIRYVGTPYHKTNSLYYGIELNSKYKNFATNNGKFNNIQYFNCDENKAIFVPADQIKSVITKKNSKKKQKNSNKKLNIGFKVAVKSVLCNGCIKYIGQHPVPVNNKNKKKSKHKIKYNTYYGIKLEKNVGNCDGTFDKNNVQYFQCKKNYGIFVKREDIIITPYIEYDTNDLLISGYLRNNEIDYVCIPSSILTLCLSFYVLTDHPLYHHLILITNRNKYADIHMINIKNNQKFKFTLNNAVSHDFSAAYCVQYKINKKMQEKYNDKMNINVNSMIMRCGGLNTSNIELVLFDSNELYNNDGIIKGYVDMIKGFGDFPVCMNSLLYDNYNNSILSVGGVEYEDDEGMFYDTHSIWLYNKNKCNELKIRLPECIKHPCTSILSTKKKSYLISGGYARRKNIASNKCYKLIKQSNKWKLIDLSTMNYGRYGHCNCRLINKYKNKIIVGGGDNENNDINVCTSFEIYDIKKNKWILMKSKSNYFHRCAAMWIDNINSNIVYVAGDVSNGCKTYEWGKHFGGYIEYKDLRDGNTKWQILTDKQENPLDIASLTVGNKIYAVII